MRAKNEFRLISEAYDIKLLAEKAVDGTLMCSKDCCGSPVMECKCGDDCPHCNCFMIQKAVKDYGLKSPLLEGAEKFDGPGMQWDGIDDEPTSDDYDAELPAGHYHTHVRLRRGGRWNAHTVNVRKTDKELIQKFLDQGFRIVKPFEEDEEVLSEIAPVVAGAAGAAARGAAVAGRGLARGAKAAAPHIKKAGNKAGKAAYHTLGAVDDIALAGVDAATDAGKKIYNKITKSEDDEYFPFSEHSKNVKMVLKAIDDFKEMVADELKVDGHPEDVNVNELHDAHKHLINAFSVMFDADDVKYITGSEDNEEPKRSITGMKQKLDALAAAQLAGSKHKPYVSSFVGGESDVFRKIFAVLGSDGKVVHKTRDKKEAHQWLKDNYENI